MKAHGTAHEAALEAQAQGDLDGLRRSRCGLKEKHGHVEIYLPELCFPPKPVSSIYLVATEIS